MSNKNDDDFLNILSALFGIGPGSTDDDLDDFSDYLESLSLLGHLGRMTDLVDRLSSLGVVNQSEVDIIMSKIEELSKQTRDALGEHNNLNDLHDFSSFEDTGDCDSDNKNSSDPNSVEARLNKKMEEILRKRREEDMSKGFYIMLMQDIHKSEKTRQMKGVAFGPFKRNIAGWKMHLLENRMARYAKKKKGDMLSFMKVRKGASLDSYKWNLVCADTRSKDRTSILFKPLNVRKCSFGFVMVREDEFNGADILDGVHLKDWHLSVDKKVRAHWNIDLISKVIAGFTYNQN